MINIAGQLAIKSIPGRFGNFNVGRLTTSIGEFVIKNAELDQYKEGKYDGDFSITGIRPSMYESGGRMVIELRAHLSGMALSNVDQLSKDEAHKLSPQEVDPIDEEQKLPQPAEATPAPETVTTSESSDPLRDTIPFGRKSSKPKSAPSPEAQPSDDLDLFGTLWPLAEVVKLDATVDRRKLRQQRDRLDAMGYEFAPLSQDWHLKAA